MASTISVLIESLNHTILLEAVMVRSWVEVVKATHSRHSYPKSPTQDKVWEIQAPNIGHWVCWLTNSSVPESNDYICKSSVLASQRSTVHYIFAFMNET